MKHHNLAFYQKKLGLQEATFSQIDHEDAIVAIVYKVAQPDGKELILKISDKAHHYFREVFFLKLFADKLPIPPLVDATLPEGNNHGAILMECLPGTLLKIDEVTEPLAHELGRCLALIHSHPFPGYGDPFQDKLDHDPREYFTFKFNEGLNECKNHLPLELLEACKNYYDSHLHLLSSVDGPCAAHRDFRPGNLLVHEGKLRGIIDWAGARASFAETDLCLLEHGDWLKEHKNTFLSGYSSVRQIPEYKHLIPLLCLYKTIATVGFLIKRGTWETTDKRLYQFNRQYLESFQNDLL